MDKTIYKKVKQFADLVNGQFNVKMIILYGSYAKGYEKKYSDIDIAVIVDKIEGDILDLNLQLYRIRRNIDERIEPILLSDQNDKSGFLSNIKKNGIIIFNKQAA